MQGGGYLSSPTVTVANFNADGTTARLYAVLGESLVKSTHITSKFDRISRIFTDECIDKCNVLKKVLKLLQVVQDK